MKNGWGGCGGSDGDHVGVNAARVMELAQLVGGAWKKTRALVNASDIPEEEPRDFGGESEGKYHGRLQGFEPRWSGQAWLGWRAMNRTKRGPGKEIRNAQHFLLEIECWVLELKKVPEQM